MNNKHKWLGRAWHAYIMAITVAFSFTAHAEESALPESFDGLELKTFDKIDYVYAKPDIDFSGYDSIIVEKGTVRFKKNWKRDYERSSRTRVRDSDILRIKTKVADTLDEVFKEAVQQNQVLKLVEEPGENTVVVRASLINLDVNAPDLRSANRTIRYVHSAGEATLFLEVYDSVSGEILARVIDHEEAREYDFLRISNSVRNNSEARQLFKRWAKRLHEQFVKVKNLQEN